MYFICLWKVSMRGPSLYMKSTFILDSSPAVVTSSERQSAKLSLSPRLTTVPSRGERHRPKAPSPWRRSKASDECDPAVGKASSRKIDLENGEDGQAPGPSNRAILMHSFNALRSNFRLGTLSSRIPSLWRVPTSWRHFPSHQAQGAASKAPQQLARPNQKLLSKPRMGRITALEHGLAISSSN